MQVHRAVEDSGLAELVAVMPGTPEHLRALRSALGLQMRLLSDPGWAVHGMLGLDQGGVRKVFLSPAAWWAFLRVFLRVIHRWRLRRPTESVLRLGGTAVIDAAGTVVGVYRSANPGDSPDPAEVVARLADVDTQHQ